MTRPFQFAAVTSKCDIHLSFSLSDLNFCSWRTDESWALSGMLRQRPNYQKFLSLAVLTCEDVLHAQVSTHYFGRLVCLKMQSCVNWIKRCQFWGSAGVFWSAAHGTESCLGLRKPRKGQGDISYWEVDLGRLYHIYGIILVALIYSVCGTVHSRDCNTYTRSWRQTIWFWLSTVFQFLELVCSDLGQQEERLWPTPATPCLRPTCSFEAKPYEDIIILVSFWFETSWKKIK